MSMLAGQSSQIQQQECQETKGTEQEWLEKMMVGWKKKQLERERLEQERLEMEREDREGCLD